MRLFFILLIALFLTACGSGVDAPVSGQTQVTIGLGQSVAVGAIVIQAMNRYLM